MRSHNLGLQCEYVRARRKKVGKSARNSKKRIGEGLEHPTIEDWWASLPATEDFEDDTDDGGARRSRIYWDRIAAQTPEEGRAHVFSATLDLTLDSRCGGIESSWSGYAEKMPTTPGLTRPYVLRCTGTHWRLGPPVVAEGACLMDVTRLLIPPGIPPIGNGPSLPSGLVPLL